MGKGLGDKLVLAISSRALFDLSESHQIYESEGVEAYRRYQIEHEDEVLMPGDAFPLVEKLLGLNTRLSEQRVEVILVSRNSADTGLRAFNSIQHYGLGISRAAFVGGRSPDPYLAAFGCHLFLSTHADDVRNALKAGFGAATLLPVARGGRTATSCVLPSMAMPYCFPTTPSASTRVAASTRSRIMSAKLLGRPCQAGLSSRFSPRCMRYSRNFPKPNARFVRRWLPRARPRHMSV